MIYKGARASAGIYTGRVRYIKSHKQLDELRPGEILGCEMTTPDWIECFGFIKEHGGGIIAKTGGLTSHAATVCREYKIPCIVSLAEVFTLHGKTVKMNGATGEVEVCD